MDPMRVPFGPPSNISALNPAVPFNQALAAIILSPFATNVCPASVTIELKVYGSLHASSGFVETKAKLLVHGASISQLSPEVEFNTPSQTVSKTPLGLLELR